MHAYMRIAMCHEFVGVCLCACVHVRTRVCMHACICVGKCACIMFALCLCDQPELIISASSSEAWLLEWPL